MNIPDAIIDFETLGTRPDSVVIDLSIVVFNSDPVSPPSYQSLVDNGLKIKFDIKSQRLSGRWIDAKTVEWWKNQSEAAKANLKPSDKDVTVAAGMQQLISFIKSQGIDPWKSRIYCRGMSFDFPILTNLLEESFGREQLDNKEPCKFWNQRDIRTAIEAYAMVKGMTTCPLPANTLSGFVHHDSIHDCAKDALMLVYAQRYAMGLEEVPSKETADPLSVNTKK